MKRVLHRYGAYRESSAAVAHGDTVFQYQFNFKVMVVVKIHFIDDQPSSLGTKQYLSNETKIYVKATIKNYLNRAPMAIPRPLLVTIPNMAFAILMSSTTFGGAIAV